MANLTASSVKTSKGMTNDRYNQNCLFAQFLFADRFVHGGRLHSHLFLLIFSQIKSHIFILHFINFIFFFISLISFECINERQWFHSKRED